MRAKAMDHLKRPKGEWPMAAHDNQLSARGELPCDMPTAPKEVWTYDPGQLPTRWAMCVDVDGDGVEEILHGPNPLVCVDAAGLERWRADVGKVVAVVDLDGDGSTEIIVDGPGILCGRTGEILWTRSGDTQIGSHRIHVGEFLPDRKGQQIGCVSEKYEHNQAEMWSFENGCGNPTLVWEREFNHGPVYAHATSSAGRYDGSRMCIAAAVHGGLVVMDPKDGSDLYRSYWEPHKNTDICRNYGGLYIGDLDGDGRSEFVILNDLISLQIGVIKPEARASGVRSPASGGEKHNQETPEPAPDVEIGELASYDAGPLLWRRYFGHWYPESDYTLHVTPTSVADVDGDGIPEIVISVHKSRWELKVYCSLTGEEKASIPDLYVHSIFDLDGDGIPEIFASTEDARTPGEFSRLVAGNILDSQWQSRFEMESCRLEHTSQIPWSLGMYGRNRDTRSPVVFERNGKSVLFLARDVSGNGRTDELVKLEGSPGDSFKTKPFLRADTLNTRVLASGKAHVLVTGDDAVIRLLGAEGDLQNEWFAGKAYQSGVVISDLDGDGRNEMALTRAGRNVIALRGASEDAPECLWEAPGWGFPAPSAYGPMLLAADFDGDGRKETLTGCLLNGGQVGVQLLGADGQQIWSTSIPGVVDTTLYDGITRATVGDFNGDGFLDVYVSGRVSGTGNDASHSFAIDGRDGNMLWHNDASSELLRLHTLGPTGLPTTADVNGDGVDDVLLIALDLCAELSGRDGEFLHTPLIANSIWQTRDMNSQWTAYGTQLPLDIDGDGELEILVSASWGQWGAWTMDRDLIWTIDPGRDGHSRRHPGIGDVDGDGKLEIGILFDGGRFGCFEAATGELKWEIQGVDSNTDVISADVDGDGNLEFVVGGSKVTAIKAISDTCGEMFWEFPVPGGCLTPSIGDVDQDGVSEIVVSCGDGKVRGYK